MANDLSSAFASLRSAFSPANPAAVLAALAEQFRAEGRYGDLFDARILAARQALGLPLVGGPSIEDLPAEIQDRMEVAQVAACREVGLLHLAAGRLSEAWMYLRVCGERSAVAAALEAAEPADEDEAEGLIDIALHQGISPRRGFQWVLKFFGTCNAVTMFERETENLQPAARREVAGLLTAHLHHELLESLRREIDREEGSIPDGDSVLDLISDREWLFRDNAYHIDTSHLSMTVRFARWVTDPAVLRQAVDLTEYGRRLAETFRHEGEEPFLDLFPHHALFFRAQLGEQVDEALAHFRERATVLAPEAFGLLPAETYVVLLERLGRTAEAFDVAVDRIPARAVRAGFASGLLDLALQSGRLDRWLEVCIERGDRIGYATALLASAR